MLFPGTPATFDEIRAMTPEALADYLTRVTYAIYGNSTGHVLVATVGLPRSGKTVWSRARGYPIVNPDSIRLAVHGQRFRREAEGLVWATAEVMVRSLFHAGHRVVVLDATNTTRKRRDGWRDPAWVTYFHHVDTPREVCLGRAAAAGDAEIVSTIERMAAAFEPLAADEPRWPS